MMAAESMDDAAVFTIDAWCQRMLREHAFDSGSLFDEELVSDEAEIMQHAVRDYWRQQVYPLRHEQFKLVRKIWPDVYALESQVQRLLSHAEQFAENATQSLSQFLTSITHEQAEIIAKVKPGWSEKVKLMAEWIAAKREENPKTFSGVKFKVATIDGLLASLQAWADNDDIFVPEQYQDIILKLSQKGIEGAFNKEFRETSIPEVFNAVAPLAEIFSQLEPVEYSLLRHAVAVIDLRIRHLKKNVRQFGFADMLQRLKQALQGENAEALRKRIVQQYPVALIDEFQDTSPDQYAIFDALYQVEKMILRRRYY